MEALNIALVGNPNVGKSTLFNALTGLRQHTGNWPGKTVDTAVGTYRYRGESYRLTDLPGLYSLQAKSEEERLAAEVVSGTLFDCTLVVCDATCLARSLILALQVMRLSRRTVVCINLSDEARLRGITTDIPTLRSLLRIPVVEISAGKREGLDRLRQTLRDVCEGFLPSSPDFSAADGERGAIALAQQAERIASQVQTKIAEPHPWRQRLDTVLLSRTFGYPTAALLLVFVLWLTIWGANYPGAALEWLFARVRLLLSHVLKPLPAGFYSFLLEGIFDTLSKVVCVMLPPMAIFFPLFTLMEDWGLLPRLAFLLDRPFERCGACGKQALTACMSLGCNAVGVTGCRIIDSPRERLLAILTCSFLPCNGRFPTLIVLVSMLFSGASFLSALMVAVCFLAAVAAVLGVSAILSRTLLRGSPFGFVLELPPFRKPQVGEVIVRSVLDRTLFVLGRALLVAAPAGALLWILSHVQIAGSTALSVCARGLEPVGVFLGMSGAILLAFILGFPANELVLPVLAMLMQGAGTLAADGAIMQTLAHRGLSGKNVVCMLVFCLFHWPCGTTLMTIKKETHSLRWTVWGFLLPTALGAALCALLNLLL